MVPGNAMDSVKSVHLVWPTWWRSWGREHLINGRISVVEDYWGHPNISIAKSEWEELWTNVCRLKKVKKLHVTIFHERELLPKQLFPAMSGVKADDIFVEAWGPEELMQEPTEEIPFPVHYTPALGPQIS